VEDSESRDQGFGLGAAALEIGGGAGGRTNDAMRWGCHRVTGRRIIGGGCRGER
jgi:hypothetical protein